MPSAEETREFGGEPVAAEIVETLPAVRAHEAIMAKGELSVEEITAQKHKIVEIMQAVMTEDVHYGRIPGIDKPSLFKPGAEAINVALRLAPVPVSERVFDGDHLTVFATVTLQHIPTGLVIAAGEGMCSSKESKYAYRQESRKCPACGAAAIIKGKAEYGGGWVCWKKKDGCGANFADGDTAIETQEAGKVANPDLPDTWNTVLKMADKRALIAAVLNGTAASDVFTQDVEDHPPATAPEPARSEPPEHRQNATAVPTPTSWPKVKDAIRACDNPDEAEALYGAFLRAATYHLYGKTSLKDITADERKVMLQKAAGAAVWLAEHEDETQDGPFNFYLEATMRQAWAAMLDGTLLEIPDYVPPEPPAPEVDEEAAELARQAFADPS